MTLTTLVPERVAHIGTPDTYDPGDVDWHMPAAMDRAEGEEYHHECDEPVYLIEARQHDQQLRLALNTAGKVAVRWEDGYLCMQYRDVHQRFRGSSVEGCDYADEFVRTLARELRDTRESVG